MNVGDVKKTLTSSSVLFNGDLTKTISILYTKSSITSVDTSVPYYIIVVISSNDAQVSLYGWPHAVNDETSSTATISLLSNTAPSVSTTAASTSVLTPTTAASVHATTSSSIVLDHTASLEVHTSSAGGGGGDVHFENSSFHPFAHVTVLIFFEKGNWLCIFMEKEFF